MNLKKQFALALASVSLGAALIGGGTFAYFSDTEKVENTFAAGNLDLSVNPTVAFDIADLAPGDYMVRSFDITNSGSLDIKSVLMHTKYEVVDKKGDNGGEDFGKHFNVEFLTSDGQVLLLNRSLADLQALTTKGSSPDITTLYTELKKLPKGDRDRIVMKIVFVDNGADQNAFQGDSIKLTWSLEAKQEAGREL